MNKIIIVVFFGLIIVGCQKRQDIIDFESELKWKSFKVINSEIDMEFTDSLYISYGLIQVENIYRIEKLSYDSARLYLGKDSTIIKASNSDYSDFIIIGENINDTLYLKLNSKKNDLNNLYGTWFENSKLSYTINDKIIQMNQNDSIYRESELSFDLLNKYLKFNLKHSENKLEYLWKIEKVDNDSMHISKNFKTDSGWSTVNNKTLIKKVN